MLGYKVELVRDELSCLATDFSKQSIKDVAWCLLAAHGKMQEERR